MNNFRKKTWLPRLAFLVMALAFGMFAHAGDGIWTRSVKGIEAERVNAILEDAAGTLYVGTRTGVYKSTDQGANWVAAKTGMGAIEVSCFTTNGAGSVYACTSAGVYKTSDGAANWQAVNSGFGVVTSIAAITLGKSGAIYAVPAGYGPFVSVDGGASWLPARTGISDFDVRSLVATDNNTLYAGLAGFGVFKTTNAGLSWASASSGLPTGTVQALIADASGAVYAAVLGNGIYKSSNGGTTWQAVNSGLPPYINALARTPSDTLVAGTTSASDSVFLSSDGGTSWTATNNGLPANDTTILTLFVTAKGNILAGKFDGFYQFSPGFKVSGTAQGANSALKLTAKVVAAVADQGLDGELYVVALLPQGDVYLLSGTTGWNKFVGNNAIGYSRVKLGTHSIDILDGSLDVGLIKGTSFVVGYGKDLPDLLERRKYGLIYTIQ